MSQADRVKSTARKIGDAIDAAMRQFDGGKGISQAALARMSGVSQPTISRILKGGNVPELENLVRIVDCLGNIDLGWSVGALLHGWNNDVSSNAKVASESFHGYINSQIPHHLKSIFELLLKTSPEGLSVVLDKARDMAKEYPSNAIEESKPESKLLNSGTRTIGPPRIRKNVKTAKSNN